MLNEEREAFMKKVLSLILCTLLSLTNVSAFAEIDYCKMYGVGCPKEEDPEYQAKPISFSSYIDFKNATADGDEIEFSIRGEQWYNNKNMVITLVLTPMDKNNLVITQKMDKETVAVLHRGDSDIIIGTEHIASTIVKTPKNNSTEPIYYKVEVKNDGQVVATSKEMFVIAGKETEKPVEIKRTYNWSNSGINVAVNKENIKFPDQKPLLETNTSRTYVPVRFLAENLGAEVDWDNEHQVVIIKNKGIEGTEVKQTHYLKIGENKFITIRDTSEEKPKANKNLVYRTFIFEFPEDIAPVLVNGRTMLPFRYVAELLGSPVYYDEKTNTAHCSKKDLSSLNGDVHIFSTVLGEYYADEANSYRKYWYEGNLPKEDEAHFNGTLSDIAVWACFDKFEHPETGWGEDIPAHTYSISLPEERGIGAFSPYRRTFNNFSTYFDHYGESSVQYEDVLFHSKVTTEDDKKEILNNIELSFNWGIENINYSNTEINLYNESSYRKISKEIIDTFHISPGHRVTILYGDGVGVGILMDI